MARIGERVMVFVLSAIAVGLVLGTTVFELSLLL